MSIKSFKVYQIKISDEIHNFANSKEGGHDNTAKKYPEYEAYLDRYQGYDAFEDSKFKYYTKVVQVKVDGGLVTKDKYGSTKPFKLERLEDVFKVLNHYFYDEDSQTDPVYENHVFDFGKKTFVDSEGQTQEYADFASLSVGDIVEDPNGDFFLVDEIGFKPILKGLNKKEAVA